MSPCLAHEFDPQRVHQILRRIARKWVAVDEEFGQNLHWSISARLEPRQNRGGLRRYATRTGLVRHDG